MEVNVKKIIQNEKAMTFTEYKEYIEQLLTKEDISTLTLRDIEIRRSLLKKLRLKIQQGRFFTNHQIKIVKDESYHDSHPKIYACTATGENDLATIFSYLKEPAWLPVEQTTNLSPLEEYLYRHHFITLYDKQVIKDLMSTYSLETINHHGNIICFPEQYISKTGEEVSPLNIEIAHYITSSDAAVIPIAITNAKTKNGLLSYITIGRNFELQSVSPEYAKDILTIIREEFVHLKQASLNSIIEDKTTILQEEEPSERHLLRP